MDKLISLVKTVVATLTDVAFRQVIVTMWEEDNPKVVDYFFIPWNYSGLFILEEINEIAFSFTIIQEIQNHQDIGKI